MSAAGRDDRGNVSVFLAVVIVLAFVVCGAIARLGGAAAARARANGAADAAALAAADELALGQPTTQACASARRIAVSNGARLAACLGSVSRDAAGSAEVTVVLAGAAARARAEVDPVAFTGRDVSGRAP